MKILVLSFAIWLFVVPTAVALFLLFTFLAAQTSDLYPAFASLVLGFSISVMVWGPFWLEPLLHVTFRPFPKFQHRTNPIQEKKYEKCLEGQARS
jgi:hypothetical protein